jgi:parallel beta-helix repeat protein
MKKFLILAIVFGIVQLAKASVVSLSLDGVNPAPQEIDVFPGQVLEMYVISDIAGMGFLEWLTNDYLSTISNVQSYPAAGDLTSIFTNEWGDIELVAQDSDGNTQAGIHFSFDLTIATDAPQGFTLCISLEGGTPIPCDFVLLNVVPEWGTLLGIEITGPEDVRRNCQAKYKALAYYDDGSKKDVTDLTSWSVEPNSIATIDEDGLLYTKDISVPQNITIYAGYVEGGVTFDDTVVVQISLPQTLYVPVEYETIQAAIDAAKCGDTILIGDGTYTGPGNRNINFRGKAITVRSENGPENCIIDCNGTEVKPHCGFYFRGREDANSILSGLTITNAYGPGFWPAYCRGGIYCLDSSPTITNCTINGNKDTGIHCRISSPTIKNCVISGNHRGIYCQESTPKIIKCIISNNTSRDFGGGIYCKDSSPKITNCTISTNVGSPGGGIYCEGGNPEITNCTITANLSQPVGGGILSTSSNPTIAKCAITGNSAWRGGGIYFWGGNPAITNCTISSNSAEYLGGGIRCYDNTSLTLANCTFADNSSPNGSALACDSYEQSNPSDLQLTNSILWNGGNEIWNNDNSTITITYSDIQDDWEGEGNIDADPLFVEPVYWDVNGLWVDGDYHLLPDSPCIDAGDPNYTAEPNETDLDGNPRVRGDAIDMGAYEYNPLVEAAMQLTPQMLNCRSKGKWIKAHFVLPEGFLPEDVDVNAPAVAEPIGAESEYIRVFGNDDGPVKLEVAFDRQAFCDLLTDGDSLEITVIGSLTTGQYFYGSDTIRIIPRRE